MNSSRSKGGHVPVIVLASGAAFLALLDATVTNLAVPGIRRDFAPLSISDATWVITAYAVVFAALLSPAGRLADVIGVRRLFVWGVGVFSAFSLLCTLASDIYWLVAGRALQAVGAAAMIPASLAILLLGVPPARRPAAVGLWSAAGSLAAAVGPALGGVLVDTVSWRVLFAINVPVGVVMCLSARVAPEGRRSAAPPDLAGAGLLAAGIAGVVLGITQASAWGWTDVGTLGLLSGGALAAAWALARSYRHTVPAIEVGLWRNRGFTVTNLVSLLYGAGLYSWLLIGVLFLTDIWRYSELRAGLAMSPGAVSAAVAAAILGRLIGRRGPRPVVIGGALAMSLAGIWLAIGLSPTPRYLALWLPVGLLAGAGMGALAAGANAAAAVYASPTRFASAIGLNTTARQLGGALGVAALAVIGQHQAGHGLAPFTYVYWFSIAAVVGAAILGLRLTPPPPAAITPRAGDLEAALPGPTTSTAAAG
ncbi:MAG TPA: MFS transporter [Micromonosporaceae bacterium]|nr:MFS transporter [Micromonosporaceae bacterium]